MNQRVEAVDAIRGFALFGILLVNMTLIQFGFFTSENQLIYSAILIKALIGLFNSSAHITLYPYFLFYLGLALFCYKKYYRKRKKFFPTYIRRIIILFTTRLHSRHFCLGGRYFICIRNNRDFLNDVHQSKTENFAHLGDYSTRTYYTYVLSNRSIYKYR